MKRYIVFDTETTGLDASGGDRIIEIGCVELIDKNRSGRTYQQYINPQRIIPNEAVEITHITNEMVADKPIFADIADSFLAFLNDNNVGAEKTFLVAHNASFDLKFLNQELKNCGRLGLDNFEIIDTLDIARRKFPNHKSSLDMLCERFGISLEERKKEGHGALLDSQILVDVFLKLIEGNENVLDRNGDLDFVGIKKRDSVLSSRIENFRASNQEIEEHKKFLLENKIIFE